MADKLQPRPDEKTVVARSAVKTDSISQIMEASFLRYSMSVIVARALPDVRDGLKPVHRRILYSMQKSGLRSNGKTVKSARIVGDVMGKYHPHGDSAIYEAMARLVADWSTRYPLVIGQGNFGSADGDPPGAQRYTEAKLSSIAEVMLEDLDKQTVDFRPNYDETETEPEVLPAKAPNLLVNGQIGIAVGMATSIPPHNLGEVIDASLHRIDQPESTVDDLLKFIKGPDFPTGGTVYAGDDLKSAYATGRGGVVVRGRAEIEPRNAQGAQRIVITEVPYGTNVSSLIERMAELVGTKKLPMIVDIGDESSRGQTRVVVDLKKEAYPKKVLNQIYKYTSLQTSFHYNMLALVDGIQPRVLGLVDLIDEHIKHRREVVRRRAEFELAKARDRAHILEGLNIALDHIEEVIKTIRASDTTDSARTALIKKFKLTLIQAQAILAMQLRQLAGLERKKIADEYAALQKQIVELETLLADSAKILAVVRAELEAVREKHADPRRSQVIATSLGQFSDEDLIPNEEVIVTLTTINYIKRSSARGYKSQGRGGKGRQGMETRDQDLIQQLIVAQTHDHLLFFTNQGRVFRLRCYEIPEAGLNAKGVAVVNLLQLRSDETISAVLKMDAAKVADGSHLFMCTKKGVVKKTSYDRYRNLRQNGLITINLDDGDELKWVRFTSGDNEVVISTANGMANRFHERDVRPMGRTARGVRGIRLRAGDEVVGMDVVVPDAKLFVISNQGYGKKTHIDNFTPHKRGGIGVRSAVVNDKTGPLVTVRGLSEQATEVIAISQAGKTIRLKLKNVPTIGRSTQGVRIMRLNKGDKVASAVIVEIDPVSEEDESGAAAKPAAKKKTATGRKKPAAKPKK